MAKKPTIIICGLAGSGKSTTAKLLAKRFRIPHVSAGDLFRAVAKKRKMSLIDLGRYAEKHPEFDKDLDALMMRRLAKGQVIVDGRAAAYLAAKRGIKALKVFLEVDPKVSAARVAKRDGIPVRQALAMSRLREKEIARRLKRLYGLDTGSTAYYDAVVQTDLYSPEETVEIISRLAR
jgi:cytidylate kinase